MSISMRQGYTQDISYWPVATPNGQGGYTYGNPENFKVRWEENRAELRLQNGEIFISRAVVYTPKMLVLGGYIAQGIMTGDPTQLDAYQVQLIRSIPDLRGDFTEYRAFL